jgi:hypothetical protein
VVKPVRTDYRDQARYVPLAGSSKCKTLVVGKGRYQERRGQTCKPRFSSMGGTISIIGGSINVEPRTRSLRHGIPHRSFHTYII